MAKSSHKQEADGWKEEDTGNEQTLALGGYDNDDNLENDPFT